VIYEIGKGEGGHAGEHYILCAGGCGAGNLECQLFDATGRNRIPREPDGYYLPEWKNFKHYAGKTIQVRCECDLPNKK
jgi:hypothetical protein